MTPTSVRPSFVSEDEQATYLREAVEMPRATPPGPARGLVQRAGQRRVDLGAAAADLGAKPRGRLRVAAEISSRVGLDGPGLARGHRHRLPAIDRRFRWRARARCVLRGRQHHPHRGDQAECEPGEQPEGIPATEMVMLHDPEGERSLVILFFETEEDYRQGDETLNAMPAGETPGRRTSVTRYDVALR